MDLLPTIDPIPLPAPVWLFKLLHSITLVLHFVSVYLLIGGLGCVLVWGALGRRRGDPVLRTAAGSLATRLPVVMAYVINLGVPPLLFAQVLYGRALYTSSVLIGAYWISVVFLLMAAYALLYRVSKKAHENAPYTLWAAAALVLVMGIGFLFSTNMSLMLRPDIWGAMYRADGFGTRLPSGLGYGLVRWAYMMIGALGLTGAALLLLPKTAILGEGVRRFHALWARRFLVYCTVAQLPLGLAVFFSQPAGVRSVFTGQWVYLGLSLIWLAAGAAVVTLAWRAAADALPVVALTAAMTVYVSVMVVVRDGIRDAALAYFGFNVWESPVATNWTVVGCFLALFVVAVVFVVGMSFLALRPAGEEEHYA